MAKTAKRLRMAVVGLGVAGRFHCESIADMVSEMTLAAVVEAVPERAREVGEKYRVPAFASIQELIAAGVCDAVSIATPHPLHAPVAVACMDAGLHVVCEKPLAESVMAARLMLRAAERNGVAFACCLQRRFEPRFEKAIAWARSGALGELRRAVLLFSDFRTQSYYDSNVWRATWKGEGGGVLLNQAPHFLDMFVQLAGVPVSVRGRLGTRLHRIEVEDQAEAIVSFRNGATGYVYCSTNEPFHRVTVEITGDKGKLVLGENSLDCYTFEPDIQTLARTGADMWARPEVKPVPFAFEEKKTGHFLLLQNFARHILLGEELRCSAQSAMGSLEIANGVVLSHFSGRDVRLPVPARAYAKLFAELQAKSTPRKRHVHVQQAVDPRMR